MQSQCSGMLYLPKYALPSLFSTGDHDLFWTETDANARALKFFTLNDANFKKWNFQYNPIPGYDQSKPFDDSANQKALENNTTNLTKFESFLYKALGSFNFNPENIPSNLDSCDICH